MTLGGPGRDTLRAGFGALEEQLRVIEVAIETQTDELRRQMEVLDLTAA